VLKKRIFVSPLNWGLGHASRCVPIINELINIGAEPIIGADGSAAIFLKEIFPDLQFISMPECNVHYKYKNMLLNIGLQMPSLIKLLNQERILTRQIVKDKKIQGIISDNRYGIAHAGIPSVFIGHQLNIKIPASFISKAVNYQNRQMLAKFDSIWVPDSDCPDNLSGELSSGFKHRDLKFIGPLSRLNPETAPKLDYKIVAILSGPEPQRTYLEKLLTTQLIELELPSLLVRGILKKGDDEQHGCLAIKNFATEDEIAALIKGSELFIARSGYSSIMDLAKMKSNHLLLVPTPGQTEQEYFAKRFSENGAALSQHQEKLNLKFAWENRKKSSGLSVEYDQTLLNQALKDFLNSIK